MSLKAQFDDGTGAVDRMGWEASLSTILRHVVGMVLKVFRRLIGST